MPDWKWTVQPTQTDLMRLIQELGCGVIVEDLDGTIRYANKRLLEWSGYEVGELEGQRVDMLVPPELYEHMAEERKAVAEGDHRTRLSVFRRKDGRTFPVAVAPQALERSEGGQVILALLFDLAEVQSARPMGTREGSLAAELSAVAQRLQAMSFTAAVANEGVAPVDHPILKELSARERETLELLVAGSRVPAIAKKLFISPNTVRNHLKAIFRKLEVSSQSELIELVRGLGRRSSN